MGNEGFDWWNESLNHDPQHCILHGFCFERFYYYQTFIFSNLFNLEKFSAFISSFSAFFASSPSLFYRYCLFSPFSCPCFRRRRREISTCATCYLSFIIHKVQIHHAIRLVEKHAYVESTSLNAVFTIFDLDLTLVCTFCIILAPSI